MSQNQGCLSLFFGWLKVDKDTNKNSEDVLSTDDHLSVADDYEGSYDSWPSVRSEKKYLYRLDRNALLSPAERSFFGVLRRAVGQQYIICPKVNMADLFWTPQQGARSRIDRKHIDFVLCCPESMSPKIGIELDDSSHGSHSAMQRDAVKNEVFAAVGLPLLRVRVKMSYNVEEVADLIRGALAQKSI